MRNVFVVLKSEFLRRARSKGFIIGTLLTPIGFLALIAVMVGIGILMSKTDTQTFAVNDQTGVLYERLVEEASSSIVLEQTDLLGDSLAAAVRADRFNGAVLLPGSLLDGEGDIELYSATSGGGNMRDGLTRDIRSIIEEVRLERVGAGPEVRAIIDSRPSSRVVRVTEDGAEEEQGVGGFVLGGVMGFLIYLSVFIYGSMVMQSVIEEKTSRVVEVMVSAVKPFDLLLGKVLGIGALGVVQQVVWLAIILGGAAAVGPIIATFADAPAATQQVEQAERIAAETGVPAEAVQTPDIPSLLPEISPVIIVAFVLFFIGGYLVYSSLFAAAGAAVEELQDAQSFTVPIMIPVILGFASMTPILESPESTFAVIMSMIPFFSPILMLARMSVTEVPAWQVLLSLSLLFGGFLATMWLSARIYRVGILSYGKKPTYGDLIKWIRAS